nr:hypothetical protein [Tanacetum cinerariifolium]
MTKVITEEFKKLESIKISDDSFTCNRLLELLYKEFNRMHKMDSDLFTYEVEIPRLASLPCDLNKEEHENKEGCKLFNNPHHETPVCNIRRFEMIKYSFGQDEDCLVGLLLFVKVRRSILMTYPPLWLEGLPFELEWDPLPNYTTRSSNSFKWHKIIFGMITSKGIRHAKTYTLHGMSSMKLGQRREITPPSGFSIPPLIPNIVTNERLTMTTTVFAATTPENTPYVYHASNSANPNSMISPPFVEANYEVLKSLLRERRSQIRNEALQTGPEYFSEDCDEE